MTFDLPARRAQAARPRLLRPPYRLLSDRPEPFQRDADMAHCNAAGLLPLAAGTAAVERGPRAPFATA